MFDNAGEKLEGIIKTTAYVEMVFAVLACLFWGFNIMGIGGGFVLLGLVIIIIGSALAIFVIWLSNLLILAFCQMCMDTAAIRHEMRNLLNETNRINDKFATFEKSAPSGSAGNTTTSANSSRNYTNNVSTPVIKSSIDYPDWKCNVCGKMVTGHHNYCVYCGNGLRSEALKKMNEEKAQGNASQPVQNPANSSAGLWTCKKCGNKNPNSVEVCHGCGAVKET